MQLYTRPLSDFTVPDSEKGIYVGSFQALGAQQNGFLILDRNYFSYFIYQDKDEGNDEYVIVSCEAEFDTTSTPKAIYNKNCIQFGVQQPYKFAFIYEITGGDVGSRLHMGLDFTEEKMPSETPPQSFDAGGIGTYLKTNNNELNGKWYGLMTDPVTGQPNQLVEATFLPSLLFVQTMNFGFWEYIG